MGWGREKERGGGGGWEGERERGDGWCEIREKVGEDKV